MYPQYKGDFAQRIICDDAYAQKSIDDFKQPEKKPRIAVSVDMMDTGIDVPECVNLVFFKKIRSKTKFWQMIGRGTRLAPNLSCVDSLNGEYTGKKYFMIFDYCGNFEYFRQKPNGFEGSDTKSLSENIYGKKIKLMVAMQDSAFATDDYQEWRKQLVTECNAQVQALNTELISVRLKREYVERYRKIDSFTYISEGAKGELITHLAPLVYMDEKDEYAKRFDNFMYGMMLAHIEAMPSFKRAKKQLCEIAAAFERKITIPQIKAKLPIIQAINTDSYWEANDLLLLEKTRMELRGLMKFLVDGGDEKKTIMTRLAFSAFINDASLNQKQIAFVHKIIHHVEQNGYMEDMKELMKPPFDKPISFMKLFDMKTRTALIEKICEIKENAVSVVA